MRGLLLQRTWLLVGRWELVVLVAMRGLVLYLLLGRGLIHHHLVLDHRRVAGVLVVPDFHHLGFLLPLDNLRVFFLYPAFGFQTPALFVHVSITAYDQVLLLPEGQEIEKLGEEG